MCLRKEKATTPQSGCNTATVSVLANPAISETECHAAARLGHGHDQEIPYTLTNRHTPTTAPTYIPRISGVKVAEKSSVCLGARCPDTSAGVRRKAIILSMSLSPDEVKRLIRVRSRRNVL